MLKLLEQEDFGYRTVNFLKEKKTLSALDKFEATG